MDRYPKRLIEVDLPIKRISEHARREKDSRQGHIPQLHIYPAARPVAACRAVICAALWPDPADELCPSAYREAAFRIMNDFAREAMNDRTVRDTLLSEITLGKVMTINQANGMFSSENPNANSMLRYFLLDFIADFANWDASTNPMFLKTARALTRAAHEALGGLSNTKPLVVDPFAGGGAIPLEALRIGADSYASDLNPVAVLLNRVIQEHVPKYGEKLVENLQEWCIWVQQNVRERLATYYPADPDGAVPIAYLWARVIISEAPSGDDIPLEVPLLRTMWLQRTRRCMRAMRWRRDNSGKVETKVVRIKYCDGNTKTVRRPLLEIFEPRSYKEVPEGTVRRGNVTCPVTNFTTSVEAVSRQFQRRRGGADDACLYAVVVDMPNGGRREFRLATDADQEAAICAASEMNRRAKDPKLLQRLTLFEPLPKQGTLGFRVQRYGMKQWGDLFLRRQLLALNEYCELSREYTNQLSRNDPDLAVAINECLALVIGRMADQNASLSTWQLNTLNSAHVFVRWALQMVWDFAEVNPTAGAGGSPDSAIRRMSSCLDHLIHASLSQGITVQASAHKSHLPNDSAQALICDPPYYDAIPYADLLDFFYVWHKRCLEKSTNNISEELSPKTDECIVDEVRGKDAEFFEKMMTRCLTEQRRVLVPLGIAVVVFAHKSTKGWERLLKSVIDAGFIITGSWPIDTELGIRLRAQDSATLSSSIHLVCRPRVNPEGSQLIDDIGDWRDVLSELPKRIHEWMPRLAQEGVVGADAIFACLGPALEIFSRYSSVEKASGEKIELKEYLEQVWGAVAREALNMIFQGADASGFEEDARLTAMWLWTLRTPDANGHAVEAEESDEGEEETRNAKSTIGGYSLEYDAARKIAQGLGVHLEALGHLVEIKGETANLLPAGARTRYLFGRDATQAPRLRRRNAERQLTFDFAHELEDVEEEAGILHGNLSARPGATVLDQLHQSMILFGAGRGEALKRFLVDEGVGRNPLFWRLAQSLSALYPSSSDEKRWVDGVMARKKGLGL